MLLINFAIPLPSTWLSHHFSCSIFHHYLVQQLPLHLFCNCHCCLLIPFNSFNLHLLCHSIHCPPKHLQLLFFYLCHPYHVASDIAVQSTQPTDLGKRIKSQLISKDIAPYAATFQVWYELICRKS